MVVVNHSPSLNVMKMTLKATKLPFQYCNALSWQQVTLSVRCSVSVIEPWRYSHSQGLRMCPTVEIRKTQPTMVWASEMVERASRSNVR